MELPAMAAKPPTRPPIKAVTNINKTVEPPKGNNSAILCDKILSLLVSIQKASTAHNRKTPRKPARKPCPIRGCMTKADRKATTATDHQGRYSPAINESKKINNVVSTNF